MTMKTKAKSLKQLLDQIAEADADGDQVSLAAILDAVGRRSFGPILLVAGLIILAPIIGDIPGVPTIMGVFVILTASQMLFHRDHFWLPRKLLRRSVQRKKLCKALEWMRSPAKFIDRFTRERLTFFVHGAGMHAVAIISISVSAATPAMEFVPFSANGAGIVLTAFGLSLIAYDGLLALIAFVFTVLTYGFIIYTLV